MTEAIKHEIHDEHFAVLVKDGEFEFWIDVSIDEQFQDVSSEWNKYIFDIPEEQHEIDYQNECDNFVKMTDCAVNYLVDKGLIYQDDEAKWHRKENING